MLSISNKDALDYCKQGDNSLAASVGFVYDATAKTIVVTDNTTYPSGDSRKLVHVEVFDYFGGRVQGDILAADSDNAITINVATLNNSRGFALSVLVVSTKGKRKDGSQFKISNSISTGSFVIEK
jgi:hypothetical protein